MSSEEYVKATMKEAFKSLEADRRTETEKEKELNDHFRELGTEREEWRRQLQRAERQLASVEVVGTAPCGCVREDNYDFVLCDAHYESCSCEGPPWDEARAVQRFLEWCGGVNDAEL